MKKIATRIFAAFMVVVMAVFAPSVAKVEAETKTVTLLDVSGEAYGTASHSFTSKKQQEAYLVLTVSRKADYTLRLENNDTGSVMSADVDSADFKYDALYGYYQYFDLGLVAAKYTLSLITDDSVEYSMYLYTTGTSMSISATKATITAGQKKTLKVTDASGTVKWSSSKKSVATVSSKGVVTAKKAGTATITASAGGEKVTCKVTVKKNEYTDTKLTKSNTGYGFAGRVHKAYYKSGKLVCQLNLVNNSSRKISKIKNITLTAKTASGKVIAKQTFKNVKPIPGTYGKKTITLKISKKNVKKKNADLRNAYISLTGNYTYRY